MSGVERSVTQLRTRGITRASPQEHRLRLPKSKPVRARQEDKMKLAIGLALLSFLPATCVAQSTSTSYWLLLQNDSRTWCGYSDSSAFRMVADTVRPTESARVTFSAGALTELTYQATPESGDWIVVDRYTPAKSGLKLRRAYLLTQENRKIIREATIDGRQLPHFHTMSVTTLDGRKTTISSVDYPDIPVRNQLSKFDFMPLAEQMKTGSQRSICQSSPLDSHG